jgi:DNA modification methylase
MSGGRMHKKQSGRKTSKDLFDKFILSDARKLRDNLLPESVDLIVTSPPYWDLIDYGTDNQIGFGQSKEEYLTDIEKVLKVCFDVLRPTGSMWLIADNYRKSGSIHLLPWEIGEHAKKAGWKIRDMVIWDKQYNVPWHQKGQMRNTSEFILFMTKSDEYKYYVDRIKELDEISKWWVDFPERFNPKGKTPTNIWSFPIRRRGTWPTPAEVNHFCSLPTGLIGRIIELTTDSGDLVLDPFAGSGVVLAQAKALGRHYLGFDINPKYKRMFAKTINEVDAEWKSIQNRRQKFASAQKSFEYSVMSLRALKFARQVTKPFFEKLSKQARGNVSAILCLADIPKEFQRDVPINVSIQIVVKAHDKAYDSALKKSGKRSNMPPLSHYGIEATIAVVTSRSLVSEYKKKNSKMKLYLYPLSNTRKYEATTTISNWFEKQMENETKKDKVIPILANVAVDVAWALEES